MRISVARVETIGKLRDDGGPGDPLDRGAPPRPSRPKCIGGRAEPRVTSQFVFIRLSRMDAAGDPETA